MPETEPTPVYEIDGHRVTALHEEIGRRLWICPCADFARRAKEGEAFWTHTVVAIERALTAGKKYR